MTPIRLAAATTRRLRLPRPRPRSRPPASLRSPSRRPRRWRRTPKRAARRGAPPRRRRRSIQLMEPGPLPDIVEGSPSAADHDHRIRLDDVQPLRGFPRGDLARPEGQIRRYGQGQVHLARISARSARGRRASCWRVAPARTSATPSSTCCSRNRRLGRSSKSRSSRFCVLAEQAGMSQADFDACLQNQQLYDSVKQSRRAGGAAVRTSIRRRRSSSTDRKLIGELAIADFDKVLAPLLK